MTSLADHKPWTDVSAGYAGWTHRQLTLYSKDTLALLEPASTDALLDVACGCGAATLTFAPHVSEVTAVDFSAGMLESLKENLSKNNIKNVTPIHGDGQSLSLPDERFDLAVSMFGLMFFPDRAAGFSELFRCLRPNGKVAVSCWPPASDSPAMQWMFDGFSAALPETPPPPRSEHALDSKEKLHRELALAGFIDIEIHDCSHDLVVEDIKTFWHQMLAGSAPVTMIRPNFSENEWSQRQNRAIEYLERNTSVPFAAPMPGFIGLGKKAS